MHRRSILVPTAAIVVAGLLVVGCGGESTPTSATSGATASPPATGAGTVATSEQPAATTTAEEASPAPTSHGTDADPPSTTAPGAPAPTTPPTSADPSRCRRLTDFDGDDGWIVVNDGVMGGRSNGELTITDSTLRFTGSVVTRGGGFTSVRLRLSGDELAGTDRVDLRVRADRRIYGLTFEDDSTAGQRSVSHRANLAVPDGHEDWTVASLPYADLVPTVFGLLVDADPFDPDEAREIGIIIADGVDGEFALEVDWIDACR